MIAKKILMSILILITITFLILSIVLYFNPNPLFKIARLVPIEAKLTKPDNYADVEAGTKVKQNINYSKNYSESSFDIYYPKQTIEKLPIVIFIHGGGFFKGEKEMAKYFGPAISIDKYAFISVDYNLVPDATVFDQINQINELLKFIKKNSDKYFLDINNINLAGSSAGGFLALQLATAYKDTKYAEELKIEIEKNINLNSILLYSAVYDLSEFQTFDGEFPLNYLLAKFGWGITGYKDWKTNKELGELLNLNKHISNDLPPMFITDGNTRTFTKQAKEYACNLDKFDVPFKTLFFDTNEKVGHGYQLKMNTKSSRYAIKESLLFLEKWNK